MPEDLRQKILVDLAFLLISLLLLLVHLVFIFFSPSSLFVCLLLSLLCFFIFFLFFILLLLLYFCIYFSPCVYSYPFSLLICFVFQFFFSHLLPHPYANSLDPYDFVFCSVFKARQREEERTNKHTKRT